MSSPVDPSNPSEARGPEPKPSRSGADTSRTTSMIGRGGKVDPDAINRARRASVVDEDAVELASDHEGEPLDDDAPTRVVFVLQRDLQKRLDKYLTDRITFMSRTQLQRLIDEGGVQVNSRPGKASTKLRVRDRVEVLVPPPPATEVRPENIPLEVMFEDEHIIVLNKRADIIVHPARSHLAGTLINALAYHFQNRSTTGGSLSGVGKEFARPGVVHRLDRHTSGLIVFAKSDEAHWRLGQQFENRTVDKRYLAITHGLVEPAVDVIDLPLGPHPSKEKGYREKYVVRHDTLGKASVTIARVRRHFPMHGPMPRPSEASPDAKLVSDGPADPRRGFSLVELELKTGRTHQIRVHLSHTGYPIVGDDMYGGRTLSSRDLPSVIASDASTSTKNAPEPEVILLARQGLHAATLGFAHPITREAMRFAAPVPEDFRGALTHLERACPEGAYALPAGASVPLADILKR